MFPFFLVCYLWKVVFSKSSIQSVWWSFPRRHRMYHNEMMNSIRFFFCALFKMKFYWQITWCVPSKTREWVIFHFEKGEWYQSTEIHIEYKMPPYGKVSSVEKSYSTSIGFFVSLFFFWLLLAFFVVQLLLSENRRKFFMKMHLTLLDIEMLTMVKLN